ncbi:MAG TPA: hypothetical protein VF444_20965 [Pseudonocardiaceae bacterium]
MYIDEGSAGDDGELHIDVDGHEYTEQENFSYANTGIDDSVMVDTGDGGHLIYTDTDHSGVADLVTEVDEHGDVVQQARFDSADHSWVDIDSAGAPGGDGAEQIVVDTGSGRQSVGEATVASAGGAPDTAVVTDGQGDTVLYTDVNRDGVADQAVEISVDGHVVVADDAGDGHWTAVQEGHLDESGQITIDEASGGTWLPPADVTPERGADNGGTAGGTAGGTVHDGASHGGTDHVAQPAATGHHRHATEVSDMSGAASDAAWGAAWHAVVDSSSGVVRIDSMTGQWISAN